MRIGRCIAYEEVEAHRAIVGDDLRYLGCSTDVLPLLDRKCSGKNECEIRAIGMSLKNVTPCFPGLNLYLEVSYTCISGNHCDSIICLLLEDNIFLLHCITFIHLNG